MNVDTDNRHKHKYAIYDFTKVNHTKLNSNALENVHIKNVPHENLN